MKRRRIKAIPIIIPSMLIGGFMGFCYMLFIISLFNF